VTAITTLAFAQQTNMMATYRQVYEQHQKTYSVQYGKALDKVAQDLRMKGDFNNFQILEAEKKRFDAENTVPTPQDAKDSFRPATEAYTQAMVTMLEKYIKALDEVIKKKVVAGRIEEAKEIKAEKDKAAFMLADMQTQLPEKVVGEKVSPKVTAPLKPSRKQERNCTLYWSCADVADVYLNGEPLQSYPQDFRTRADEASKRFSAEATISKGDVITVGARRGGSFGFLMVIMENGKKTVWKTDRKTWRTYDPKDKTQWYLAGEANAAKKGKVSANPNPWSPQVAILSTFDAKAESVWGDPGEPTVFLVTTVD